MTPGSRTTSRATRSGRRGSSRSRPRWSATTGSAGSASRRRGRRATQLDARASAGARRPDRGALGARRRRDRPRHVGRRRAPTRPRCARRAGRSRWSTRCCATASRAASPRCARPATTPRRRARWASASSTTSPSRRAHARAAHGAERVLILDWDVHHGNGTNDIFHADPAVLFCSIHEWPLYPGTGPARTSARAPGEGFTVNLPVPGGSGDAVHGSLVEHVVAPLIRALGAAARARLGRLRRAPRRPAGDAAADRGRLRRDDRLAAARVRGRSARRSGWCSRAATRSTRWPPRWPPSCRCSARRRSRPRPSVEVHPLALAASERLARVVAALSRARCGGCRRPWRRCRRARRSPRTGCRSGRRTRPRSRP